jgi:hypothetical protein
LLVLELGRHRYYMATRPLDDRFQPGHLCARGPALLARFGERLDALRCRRLAGRFGGGLGLRGAPGPNRRMLFELRRKKLLRFRFSFGSPRSLFGRGIAEARCEDRAALDLDRVLLGHQWLPPSAVMRRVQSLEAAQPGTVVICRDVTRRWGDRPR